MAKTCVRGRQQPVWRVVRSLRATAFVFCLIANLSAQTDSEAPVKSLRPVKTATAVSPSGPVPTLWVEPTDIATRDLRYGEGGAKDAPHATVFAFDKEDLSGSNPKYVVRDPDGVKWKIKLGAEAKPEVAASRLVWAVGYFTKEDYFLSQLQVTGLPGNLHRGRQFFAKDGTVRDARLQRMDKKEAKEGSWSWKHDPFVGTREWNGLRVLMALMNNWDLKDENNKALLEIEDSGGTPAKEIYMVSDLGATFGPTGLALGGYNSRGNLARFRSSKFVTKTTAQEVDFATPSRATFLEIFNLPEYIMRLRLRWIGKHIPRSDAKWIATTLARLSPEQIRDAFRAAGYSAAEVEGFATIIQDRILKLGEM